VWRLGFREEGRGGREGVSLFSARGAEGERASVEGGRESASQKVRPSFCLHFILFRSREGEGPHF
jgi:hypothetical protein